ncbi:hypothetical protein [Streptomyces violascens]|uniref:hypothetical protein n=1 Tax=Streptomyces violascens TaxID=67381 RepID=UPI0016795D8F|nr:hypothetical protein [Streptomyces violascens]GGT85727.1 hypothetical protein GCM10010289_01760 [Streptomyces violascens]
MSIDSDTAQLYGHAVPLPPSSRASLGLRSPSPLIQACKVYRAQFPGPGKTNKNVIGKTGVIKRLAQGEFTEVHKPLNQGALFTYTQHEQPQSLGIGPETDDQGVVHKTGRITRLRAKLSRGYYGEGSQISKPTAEEYEEITSSPRQH